MRWSLCVVVLSFSTSSFADDIVRELERIEGLTILAEQAEPIPGHRFFVLSYEQHVDHLDPSRGTFQQRMTLLHRSESAPTVAFTTGYGLVATPFRDEPTALVEGNQLGIEERFFGPSIPAPADYGDLNIYQAAADHHRIIDALRSIYRGKWLSTGGSKGGMASVYHRRFFDADVDGSVIYVAPNDVVDSEDVYDEFLENVGTASCRESLIEVTRAALERRDEIVPVLEAVAAEVGLTFDRMGSADAAFECSVTSLYWAFWQARLEEDCELVPSADAPLDELIGFVSDVAGLLSCVDAVLDYYVPYFYQAGTQLGSPDTSDWLMAIADLLRYPSEGPRAYVPDEIPMTFDPFAMADIDHWVKHEGHQLLFIYGENDPWSAERFEAGSGTTDSAWYTVAGGNHGAGIFDLPQSEQLEAANAVRRWAGLPPLAADPALAPGLRPTPVETLVRSTPIDRHHVVVAPKP
jgi:hypothetical protein